MRRESAAVLPGPLGTDSYPSPLCSSVPSLRPFTLRMRGGSWNAQALFAAKPTLEDSRFKIISCILPSVDFCVFSETHSTHCRALALDARYRQEFVWFYVHGTRSAKGLGLAVRRTFLANFSYHAWLQVHSSSVGVLRLDGPHGPLDLYACYLDSQHAHIRTTQLRAIHSMFRGSQSCTSVLLGDFNCTRTGLDRFRVQPKRPAPTPPTTPASDEGATDFVGGRIP